METGIISNCTRCGQGIKNIFEYQGKPYGSECVQIVSGIKVWEMGNKRNVDEYIKFKADRHAQIEARETEEQKTREYYYEKNGWLIDYLMDKDNKRYYPPSGIEIRIQEKGFCYSIAQELFMKEIEDLTDRQFQIVADMWSKEFGGRSGSKKYDKAWDEFCDKCGLE
ncbi:hypothetical protein GRF59_15060 [Paenibacillus sp. HJL G12]|uniref:Uncharacterized protein n=1 Tax=Paenibacillus dendrobii TaxID=2691084 RepID=A0A7X3ILN6_9BACL|nr:hypothetical protein [Paenibacillus dendrobii]MWV44940.1 hypothetical protein [Paenibacillus dendrobii]